MKDDFIIKIKIPQNEIQLWLSFNFQVKCKYEVSEKTVIISVLTFKAKNHSVEHTQSRFFVMVGSTQMSASTRRESNNSALHR